MTYTLSEAESRRLVGRHGVSVSPFVTGSSTEAVITAVDATPELRFPLAAKLSGRAIAHKTERGLIRLGIADRDSLAARCEELMPATTERDGPVELLVTTMVDGVRELIAGATRDPQYGMVLMLGLGGVLAEAVGDVAFRLLPAARVDIEELVDDLGNQRIFGELRGEPEVSRVALVETLQALARAATEEPDVVSIDLNPLIIADGLPVAVDALVELADADAAP